MKLKEVYSTVRFASFTDPKVAAPSRHRVCALPMLFIFWRGFNKSFFCDQKVERPILRWDPGGAQDRSAGALDRYFSIWNSLSSKRSFLIEFYEHR